MLPGKRGANQNCRVDSLHQTAQPCVTGPTTSSSTNPTDTSSSLGRTRLLLIERRAIHLACRQKPHVFRNGEFPIMPLSKRPSPPSPGFNDRPGIPNTPHSRPGNRQPNHPNNQLHQHPRPDDLHLPRKTTSRLKKKPRSRKHGTCSAWMPMTKACRRNSRMRRKWEW